MDHNRTTWVHCYYLKALWALHVWEILACPSKEHCGFTLDKKICSLESLNKLSVTLSFSWPTKNKTRETCFILKAKDSMTFAIEIIHSLDYVGFNQNVYCNFTWNSLYDKTNKANECFLSPLYTVFYIMDIYHMFSALCWKVFEWKCWKVGSTVKHFITCLYSSKTIFLN